MILFCPSISAPEAGCATGCRCVTRRARTPVDRPESRSRERASVRPDNGDIDRVCCNHSQTRVGDRADNDSSQRWMSVLSKERVEAPLVRRQGRAHSIVHPRPRAASVRPTHADIGHRKGTGPVLTHFRSGRQNTDVYSARLPGELLTRRAIIEGPLFVLAEAERRECAIREVYVSRRTDPDLIRHLQRVVRDGIPITETSVAELNSIAGSTRHGGVVATVSGGHRRRSVTEEQLWSVFRLALARSARSPERL